MLKTELIQPYPRWNYRHFTPHNVIFHKVTLPAVFLRRREERERGIRREITEDVMVLEVETNIQH